MPPSHFLFRGRNVENLGKARFADGFFKSEKSRLGPFIESGKDTPVEFNCKRFITLKFSSGCDSMRRARLDEVHIGDIGNTLGPKGLPMDSL